MAELRLCSIPNCGKTTKRGGRGYCRMHYKRVTRLGTTELDGYLRPAQRYFFEVAMKLEGGPETPCLIWPFPLGKNGYGRVAYKGKTYAVHRLACLLKQGRPKAPKNHAAHLCGVRSCCNPGHITWATVKENQSHTIIHGTRLRGERQNGAVLRESDVREIRSLLGKLRQKDIAAKFGVTRSAIYAIKAGTAWAWLDG